MTKFDSETGDLGYDPIRGSYHLHHDWTSPNPLSQTVMYVVLALSGKEPSSGPPLSDSVDPDALDQLFRGKLMDDRHHDHLTFTHDECTITVFRNGRVVAYPPACEGDAALRNY
ncbi:MAG: HalOD1 output domain-containing protein [Halobacteriota archaeon]|uniref:HalOD1 output domain-containing protein n=1 Tax=Natronomonas sp. TaxID=2184060 RepID=UPI0039771C0B